jgi:hypothetical protein
VEEERESVCERCKQPVIWSEWRNSDIAGQGQIRTGRCGCPGLGRVQARPGRKKRDAQQ